MCVMCFDVCDVFHLPCPKLVTRISTSLWPLLLKANNELIGSAPLLNTKIKGVALLLTAKAAGKFNAGASPYLSPNVAVREREEGKGRERIPREYRENTERIPREYRENIERIPREYREKREKREKRKKRANREKRETRENRENIEGDQSTVQNNRFVSFLTFHKHVCSLDQQIGPNRFHHQQPLKRGQLAPPRRKQQPLPLLKPPTILERERHRGKSRNKPRDIEGKIEGSRGISRDREGYRELSRIIENYEYKTLSSTCVKWRRRNLPGTVAPLLLVLTHMSF
jgi:hypothetical protein